LQSDDFLLLCRNFLHQLTCKFFAVPDHCPVIHPSSILSNSLDFSLPFLGVLVPLCCFWLFIEIEMISVGLEQATDNKKLKGGSLRVTQHRVSADLAIKNFQASQAIESLSEDSL
jgi:hypothetical protein